MDLPRVRAREGSCHGCAPVAGSAGWRVGAAALSCAAGWVGSLIPVDAARRGARACQQGLCAHVFPPRRQPHRDLQRLARAPGFDLDRAQPLERTPGHDLCPRAVGAGQDDQQIVIRVPPTPPAPADPVEAAQLAPQRSRHVLECLLAQLAPVLARHLVEVVDHDQQAAQLGAVAFGAAHLLLQALAQRRPASGSRSRPAGADRSADGGRWQPCL